MHFGLTTSEVLQALGPQVQMSDLDTSQGAGDGASVMASALKHQESFLKAYLPTKVLRLLKKIELEVIAEDGLEDQTTASLGAKTSDDNSVYIWRFTGNRIYADSFKRKNADVTGSTTFTIADNKDITFITPLVDGEKVIASYPCNLVNDCSSLAGILKGFVVCELGSALFDDADQMARWDTIKEDAVELLKDVQKSKALPPELAEIEFYIPLEVNRSRRIVNLKFMEP